MTLCSLYSGTVSTLYSDIYMYSYTVYISFIMTFTLCTLPLYSNTVLHIATLYSGNVYAAVTLCNSTV